jgi:hypothetical protein
MVWLRRCRALLRKLRALLALIPLAPFSHTGRRGILGVLTPETEDGMPGLATAPHPSNSLFPHGEKGESGRSDA